MLLQEKEEVGEMTQWITTHTTLAEGPRFSSKHLHWSAHNHL